MFFLNELRGRREYSSTSTSSGVGGAQRQQAGRDGGIFWAKRETHQPFRCGRVKTGVRMSVGRRHRTARGGLIHRTIEKPSCGRRKRILLSPYGTRKSLSVFSLHFSARICLPTAGPVYPIFHSIFYGLLEICRSLFYFNNNIFNFFFTIFCST